MQDGDEANQITQQLVCSAGISPHIGDSFSNQRRGITVAEGVEASYYEIHGREPRQLFREQISRSWARPCPATDGQFELCLNVENIEYAARLYLALTTAHDFRITTRNALQTRIDSFDARYGRGEWAYHTFYDWAANLSEVERNALIAIGGPSYHAINTHLRTSGAINDTSEWNTTIQSLDAAINAGVLENDVTAYRATRHPVASSGFIDSAYTFVTLDRDIAQWWNTIMLRGFGHVIQIKIPAGTHAAYLDAEGNYEYRGFQELLLPRETRFATIEHMSTPTLHVIGTG